MPWTYEERKKGAAVIVVPESKVCTNRVRGRLCRSCNLMLGYAEDDPERLKLGIAYLERTSHASD